jgi:hypothetical protein
MKILSLFSPFKVEVFICKLLYSAEVNNKVHKGVDAISPLIQDLVKLESVSKVWQSASKSRSVWAPIIQLILVSSPQNLLAKYALRAHFVGFVTFFLEVRP